jgi:hypothetical protein
MKTRFMQLLIGLTILGVVLTACGPAPTPEAAAEEATGAMAAPEATTAEQPATDAVTSMTGAGDLRVALNALLGEHALLALNATDAALRGSDAEFQAAAAALG